MGRSASPAPPPPLPMPGEHGLFGLRAATPAIACALRQAWQVRHDLPDLGMSEADWARLYALSRG